MLTEISETVIKLWNGWEIRVLVLLSLLLQVMLIVLGAQRKRLVNTWIRLLVWTAYLSADWVATFALGILARTLGRDSGNDTPNPKPNGSLQSFWAPFLLLHLGGPDTITAYSLEDNELWPRHLLSLLVETGVALYVSYRSWKLNHSALTFIAIPVFVAGVIKYGERTWVLRSSSTKCFRNSLLSAPDPGPDYVEFIERQIEDDELQLDVELPKKWKPPADFFGQANYLFEIFKYLFAGLILGQYERKDCLSIISTKSAKEAFKLVEVELGFLYDVLYTKATVVFSWLGILLRCITSLSSVSALITFSIIIDKRAYSRMDIFVTYILLVGAVVLEVYALVIVFYSDWINLWPVRRQNSYAKKVMTANRWSGTIGKCNLLERCLKEKAPTWIKVQKLLGIHEILEKHLSVTRHDVDAKLEDMIFDYLRDKSLKMFEEDNGTDVNDCKELLKSRGKYVLEENGLKDLLEWSTVEVEFDHSLLLWHIATELCYHADKREFEDFVSLDDYSKVSKCLSEYLLYLLVVCPKMLPKGIGELRYRDTCAEAIRFFKQRRGVIETNVGKACELLFEMGVDKSVLDKVKGNRTKSVLFYGNRLAKELQSLNSKPNWGRERKWETMNKLWMELLCYAAVHCGWKEHAQQLGQGGEWLTHVCLLMAHLGLSEQYQEQKQYVLPETPRTTELRRQNAFNERLLFDKKANLGLSEQYQEQKQYVLPETPRTGAFRRLTLLMSACCLARRQTLA